MIDYKKLKIGSSNINKIREYQEIVPEFESIKIKDLREIKSSNDLIIKYKVKELNQEGVILEDTILEVFVNNEWEEIVDVKWKINELPKTKARWIVSLGFLFDEKVYICRATLTGIIFPELYIEDSFGFDSIFIPEGYSDSLKILQEKGLKKTFSPRKTAILKIKNYDYDEIVPIHDLVNWTGPYQNE